MAGRSVIIKFAQIPATLGCLTASALASAQSIRVPITPTTQPGSSPAARTLTIGEAVTLGLRNSKQLRITAEGVNRARGRVNENLAGYLPSLSSDVSFTHLDEGSTVIFPGPTGQPQTIPIVKQDQ